MGKTEKTLKPGAAQGERELSNRRIRTKGVRDVIRLDPAMKLYLQEIAEEEGMSSAGLVKMIVHQWVRKNKGKTLRDVRAEYPDT